MEQHYYTYYEAFNAQGNMLYHGNSSFYVEAARATGAAVDDHVSQVLRSVQEKVPDVTFVALKMIVKL